MYHLFKIKNNSAPCIMQDGVATCIVLGYKHPEEYIHKWKTVPNYGIRVEKLTQEDIEVLYSSDSVEDVISYYKMIRILE